MREGKKYSPNARRLTLAALIACFPPFFYTKEGTRRTVGWMVGEWGEDDGGGSESHQKEKRKIRIKKSKGNNNDKRRV
jgi:hypothetical protein